MSLNDEKKKSVEKDCIKIAISQLPQLKGYIIESEEERPDFILTNGNTRLGMEHFLVDALFKKSQNKKTGETEYSSFSRPSNVKCMQIYNNLCDDVVGNRKVAVKDTENVLNEMFEASATFSSEIFEKEFARVFLNHIKKCSQYRENLQDASAKLGFVCEVNTAYNDNEWIVHDKKGFRKQRIKGIPLTKCVWMLVQAFLLMGIIDFFVFVVRSGMKKEATTLYFTKDSEPTTYYWFGYKNVGCHIKANLILEENC